MLFLYTEPNMVEEYFLHQNPLPSESGPESVSLTPQFELLPSTEYGFLRKFPAIRYVILGLPLPIHEILKNSVLNCQSENLVSLFC